MPYIDLLVYPSVRPEQALLLARRITNAMEEVMGKRRDVTAVRIAGADTVLWTVGGEASRESAAYLDVKITAGTNHAEEKTALVARLHELLANTLGGLAEASYIVVHELPADNWGYAGATQAARLAQKKETTL